MDYQSRLFEVLERHPVAGPILSGQPFPDTTDWFLGAGDICQAVWNDLTKRDPTYGIGDYDLIYYDESLSAEAERREQDRVDKQFAQLKAPIEVVNEARVHLWYKDQFGKDIKPYKSCQDAIDHWPSTATCVGVRRQDGELLCYAPFGLNDIFDLIVRPNKRQVTREVYESKSAKWLSKWPELTVISWDD